MFPINPDMYFPCSNGKKLNIHCRSANVQTCDFILSLVCLESRANFGRRHNKQNYSFILKSHRSWFSDRDLYQR